MIARLTTKNKHHVKLGINKWHCSRDFVGKKKKNSKK